MSKEQQPEITEFLEKVRAFAENIKYAVQSMSVTFICDDGVEIKYSSRKLRVPSPLAPQSKR
jgi:hypothetical protein